VIPSVGGLGPSRFPSFQAPCFFLTPPEEPIPSVRRGLVAVSDFFPPVYPSSEVFLLRSPIGISFFFSLSPYVLSSLFNFEPSSWDSLPLLNRTATIVVRPVAFLAFHPGKIRASIIPAFFPSPPADKHSFIQRGPAFPSTRCGSVLALLEPSLTTRSVLPLFFPSLES